jgi:putative oxidoreductase
MATSIACVDDLSPRRQPRTGDPLARVLAPYAPAAYTLLRVFAGLLFAFHGAQKLFNWYMPFEIPVGSQVWIGGIIELVTGLAIAAGVRTTWAAFLASGTMAVAYIQFHWRFDFGDKFLPAVNQGEPALINALLFLYIACRGGRPLWSSRRA